MNIDPLFGTLTQIVRGASPVNAPLASISPADFRVQQITDAARKIRAILFRNVEKVDGTPADMLPEGEQSHLLMSAFCGRMKTIEPYRDSALELDEALADFRELVPLVPMNYFDSLSYENVFASSDELKSLVADFKSGGIDEAFFEKKLRNIAANAKVQYPADQSPLDAAETIRGSIDVASSAGPALVEFAQGAESRVYLSQANSTIYKTLPFKGELLHVKPVLGPDPLEVEPDGGAFLADAHGGMPLFDRARLLGLTPGVCKTELVGITSGGMAIYKQPYLGDVEPTEAAIEEWSNQFDHAALPEQSDVGHPAMHASNKRPFVTRSPSAGKFVVGMDLTPANCRLWNGQCIPFDPVLRELQPDEILNHPDLTIAVAEVKKKLSRSQNSPDI